MTDSIPPNTTPQTAKELLFRFTDYEGIQQLKAGEFGLVENKFARADRVQRRSIWFRIALSLVFGAAFLDFSEGGPFSGTSLFVLIYLAIHLAGVYGDHRKWQMGRTQRSELLLIARRTDIQA